jgi:hypothetical protein
VNVILQIAKKDVTLAVNSVRDFGSLIRRTADYNPRTEGKTFATETQEDLDYFTKSSLASVVGCTF